MLCLAWPLSSLQAQDDTQEPEEQEGEDVVITGTRLPHQADDAPVRTQVIDRKQLEQRKSRDLSEALSYTTGVRVETNCQNCGFTQLRLNGLGGAYTQVLIDGLPSFSGLASVYGLEQLPTELMERVEVVKGGGSSLYGPSAVAGVVNLITRRPRRDFVSAQLSYDHLALQAPDIRLSVDGAVLSQDRDAAAHIFVTTRRRAEVDLNDDGFTEVTRVRQLVGGANLFLKPWDGGDLRLKFHIVQEYRRGGDHLDLPPHEAEIAEELQTERLQGELRWTQRLSSRLRYRLGYVLAYTDRRSYYGGGGQVEPTLPPTGQPVGDDFREDFTTERAALGGYGLTRNPLHVGDAHMELSFEAHGLHVITLGTQGTLDHVEDRYLGYQRRIDATYTVLGAYLEHNWLFADWGESVLGLRVDQHSELEAPVASPRVALILLPGADLRLRSALSTGFRAPQAFDEDLHIETVGGTARILSNDPKLKPERSLTLSQQVSWLYTLEAGQELRLSASAYFNQLRDAFVVNERDKPDTVEEELLRSNRGTTTVLGAELEASFESEHLALRVGWTLERARNDEADEDFGRKRLFRTPRQYGYTDALLSLEAWRLQSGLELTGPMLTPRYNADADPLEVNTSPWFYVWNLNLSYEGLQASGLQLSPFVGVRNLLDSRQRDLEVGADRDSSYVYGPAQPRSVFAGLRGKL